MVEVGLGCWDMVTCGLRWAGYQEGSRTRLSKGVSDSDVGWQLLVEVRLGGL